MTLTIALEPDLEKRLLEQASRVGLEPGEYARRLIAERLPSVEPATPHAKGLSPEAMETLKILKDWERENATEDPDEIARRIKEGDEFMQSLARNRVNIEGSDARK